MRGVATTSLTDNASANKRSPHSRPPVSVLEIAVWRGGQMKGRQRTALSGRGQLGRPDGWSLNTPATVKWGYLKPFLMFLLYYPYNRISSLESISCVLNTIF